ncbi:MAG: glycogen debranching protein GlgX [Spirulinaceae cyanobacterium SM2_1_0]|nr:glycogen debranching protein GlgX [Spirulinaceae cyanobacterium SM2_1_0]
MSDLLPGRSFPLGATVYPSGVNFCLFSANCTGVELLLFDTPNAPKPARVIRLDPQRDRTVFYWHIFVKGAIAGQVYAYRVHGLHDPERGLRFDSEKVLLDPYARAVVGWKTYDREAAIHPGDNCAQALRGVVVDPSRYDWEDDVPLRTSYERSVIYEMHVGGFTRHPSSGIAVEKRGTYAGLIEKIPYLQSLGITAVELLPIHQFDEQDVRPGLSNYWGYSTLAFFAPHRPYSSRQDALGPVDEFRDLVKALHKAGIEVILDVVFNHTAEGNEFGPTISFRGIDNLTYYLLEEDLSFYSNYSGCGNTVRANHPVVSRLILDSLRYWVDEMHVDGFRFDLASILSRGPYGKPLAQSPILWAIEAAPELVESKAIAEAWDAAGLYEVGKFINSSERFAEWNGPFRDDVRRFVKSDAGVVGKLAARLLGSPDIYDRDDYRPCRSINFVTCHDGFTLNDLVAYDQKHNEANGENNRDGANDNYSWNCGVEGETGDREILGLRRRQIKNFLTILFLSQGTPMILMGDEVRHSQQGNNNAYCQNNELSWLDWQQVQAQTGLLRFVQELIRYTQSLLIFEQESLLSVASSSVQAMVELSDRPHAIWHGTKLDTPDWRPESRRLAMTLCHPEAGEVLHAIFNAHWQPAAFELPYYPNRHWHRILDTALPTPDDFCRPEKAPSVTTAKYWTAPRTTVLLQAF